MDFTLPARSGTGVSLSKQEFNNLYRKYRRASFFSKELCTYYFNYRQGNSAHFVLYDNSRSIKSKLGVASKFGISSALFYYPEVSDILNDIL